MMAKSTVEDGEAVNSNTEKLIKKLTFLFTPQSIQGMRILCIGSGGGPDRTAKYGKVSVKIEGYTGGNFSTVPVQIEIEGIAGKIMLEDWMFDPRGLAFEMDEKGVKDEDLQPLYEAIANYSSITGLQ